jgi:hypothetical protein
MLISPFSKRQITQQRTPASFPCLIEITHDDYPDMYYTNASENITYEGKVYNAAAFSIQPPDRDGSRIGDATLTISAVDQVWTEKIRSTQKPAKLRFIAVIVYREGSISGIEPLEENSFTLRTASWGSGPSISWTMHFDENMAIIVPSENCNAQTTPGIT